MSPIFGLYLTVFTRIRQTTDHQGTRLLWLDGIWRCHLYHIWAEQGCRQGDGVTFRTTHPTSLPQTLPGVHQTLWITRDKALWTHSCCSLHWSINVLTRYLLHDWQYGYLTCRRGPGDWGWPGISCLWGIAELDATANTNKALSALVNLLLCRSPQACELNNLVHDKYTITLVVY